MLDRINAKTCKDDSLFNDLSPTDMHAESRTNQFQEGGNYTCLGGLIGHSNTKGDGDHSASDGNHNASDSDHKRSS